MSDLMQRPHDAPPPEGTPRKGSSPLIWILVLVALVALGWYFLTQRSSTPPPAVPDAPVIGDGTSPSVEREPASTTPARPAAESQRAAVPADRDARPREQSEPTYPPAAARNREEGTVVVLVQVGTDGKPTDVSVETRSRSRDLDRAAVDAVRGWTFDPAIRDGKPQASAVRVPVEFTLEDRAGTAARN